MAPRFIDGLSDPALLAKLAALFSTVSFVFGMIGSRLERTGEAIGSPRLVRVGKALEALFADTPKLGANVKGDVQ